MPLLARVPWRIWRLDWADKSVWMFTFALTVMADLTLAVEILRIHGPFLFGMTDKLFEATADLSRFAPIVIVRLRNMTAIDATGLHALELLSDRLKRSGRRMLLCGARRQPARFLHQAEFIEHVGARNCLPHVEAALARAREIQEGFSGVGESAARDLVRASL